MALVIPIDECLSDSPRFRAQLAAHENNLDDLEQRLEKVLKLSGGVGETGRAHVAAQTQFLSSLWELSAYFGLEQQPGSAGAALAHINRMIQTVHEVVKLENAAFDAAAKGMQRVIEQFLREDVKQMRDTKGYFNKISGDLDSALAKNAAASKGRPGDVDDASNVLTATRSCFRYTTLDYVYQISMLQSKKAHEALEALQKHYDAYADFFGRGAALFDGDECAEQTAALRADIADLRAGSKALEKNLERRHTHVSQNEVEVMEQRRMARGNGNNGSVEGYLFKRGQNAFRTWNRRWFYLQNNKLCYSKRTGEDVTVMEDDLRLCLVRPLLDIDRRFCFEVISPLKSHVLQADSEDVAKLWIENLKKSISSAHHQTMVDDERANDAVPGPKAAAGQWDDSDIEDEERGGNGNGGGTTKASTLGKSGTNRRARTARQILLIPGNEVCCDCGSRDPKWASINLGVTLCIACSGVHRSLGVHISKVRSLTLDSWEPEILKVMAELGNTISNKIYEAQVHEVVAKRASPDSDDAVRENWVKAKYVAKAFIRTDLLAAMTLPQRTDGAGAAATSTSRGNTGKWTVRKLRRRTRTSKQQASAKEKLDKDDKDVDTKQAAVVASKSAGASSASVPKINAEEILFGSTLGKHHVANIELDSDQESTDGENEGGAGGEPDGDDLLLLGKLTPNHLLYRAARVHNLPVMSQALALGADRDFFLPGGDSSVIHQSILSGSVMACEFLLLNGARINAVDGEKNTPLHLAAKHGNTGQVCLLLKARADHSKRNARGQLPVDMAIANSDADIVTVLRLASLKEEMGLEEGGGGGAAGGAGPGDDTFNDVVQEFSQMVYTHPERLHKKGAGFQDKSGKN